jgi:RNA polymerase sigma factor (sigma-70 family)
MADDAAIVARVLANDPNAFGELYDRWYDRVLDLAFRIVLDTDAAAAVAQDTFLAAFRNLGRLEDPDAFGGWLLRIARNRAIDRYRSMPRPQTLADAQPAPIDRAPERPEDTIGALDDPAGVAANTAYAAMLWDAADALGARDREVLDLSLRHGLTPAEVGEVLRIDGALAGQLAQRARQRIGPALEARVLWRAGTPACPALRADLVADDIETFDGEAVRVAQRHAPGCTECTSRKALAIDPARLFAAVPIISIPELRTRVAYALATAGVPMAGSHAFDGGAPPPAARPKRERNGPSGWVIAAAVVGLIAIIALIVGLTQVGHGPHHVVVIAAKSTTTTSSSSSTTSTSSTTTSSSTTTTTTTVAVTVPPPVTTTTQPPVIVHYTLAPSTVTQGYTTSPGSAPALAWNTSGLARVEVYDAAKTFDSTSASGSALVCPGKAQTTAGGTCTAKPGTYVYTLDGFDAGNNLVVHRTLTLTIKAAGP